MDTQESQHRPASHRARARDQRSDRRGSILIFVVGILLLLAIVATAFLGTSRSDRTSTQQNAVNTQIDLLLEGVVNAAKGQIIGDETVPGGSTLENWDAITYSDSVAPAGPSTNDSWLASRAPTLEDPNSVYAGNPLNNAGTNPCWWLGLSAPVLGDGNFESPYLSATMTTGGLPPNYATRNRMQPTFVSFGGQNWPAMMVNGTPYLAADADGDGVADSGLFRIPIGQLGGVTYYGAVRIIDNNSAINLNTAMSKTFSFDGAGAGTLLSSTIPGDPKLAGAFAGDIGLAEVLRSWSFASSAPQFDTMSTKEFGTIFEFPYLNEYRFGYPVALTGTAPQVRPTGVTGTAPDTAPYDDTSVSGGTLGARNDFRLASMADALESQLGRRVNNPTVTQFGAAVTQLTAKSAFVDSLTLTQRFTIGNSSDFTATTPPIASNSLVQALAFSVLRGPGTTSIPTQAYNGTSGSGIDTWFQQNFDYLKEDLTSASTYSNSAMNRRTILTGVSSTGNQATTAVLPPDYLYTLSASQWSGSPAFRNRNAYTEYNVNGSVALPLPMYVASLNNVATTPTGTTDPKISINQGRFEELFYGYFKVMAHSGFDGLADDFGTPFSVLYNGNSAGSTNSAINARSTVTFDATQGNYAANGLYYQDPYIGMRFTPSTSASVTFPNRIEPMGQASVINGQTSTSTPPAVEQHPLRMFRSVIRAPHDRASAPPTAPAGYWDANTTRLPADQVLILRSALAAANLEALRDSSWNPTSQNFNARTLMHDIPLTAMVGGVAKPVVAHVYGLRSQPFITEVYANSFTGADTTGSAANTGGYVAIKLYNPTGVTISLKNCRLVGLRRIIDSTLTTVPAAPTLATYPKMQVADLASPLPAVGGNTVDQIDLGTAVSNLASGATYQGYQIPPNGTLVLENYSAGPPSTNTDDASHRPASTTLSPTGPITPASTAINFAFVPGLQRVVFDRDLVLMRPTNCTPPVASTTPPNILEYTYSDPATVPVVVSRMVPLDSYDFTGLRLSDGTTTIRPGAWHYVRSVNSVKPWQWVYPGRYDADQSIAATGSSSRPRQQGTQEAFGSDAAAGFAAADMDPWSEGTNPNNATLPIISLNIDPATATLALYPDLFTIQLNMPGWPSDNPLHDYTATGNGIPNRFPFGGYRRVGDLLEAPFIGSYTIQTEDDIVNGVDSFLEINPVTMDSALAEDTDPSDNELATDNGTQSREQIGRLVPLRPSYGTAPNSGAPAVDTANTTTNPQTISQDNDTGFQADVNRYGDSKLDDDSAAIPPTTPAQVRTNRYPFAAALFDEFTLNSPHDDYVANYPTQMPWLSGTAYAIGDTVQFGQNIYVCLSAHTSAASASMDNLNPGTSADPSTSPPTLAVMPAPSANWLPLPRNQVSNSGGNPGSRSDLNAASGVDFDYYFKDDAYETTESTQGLININTAPEKVLAMVPWVPSNTPIGDGLMFTTTTYPATVTLNTDGVDDNAEIAHAIVQYRDGVYQPVASPSNDLNVTTPSTAHAHAAMPFTTLFDLYKVPELRKAQEAILSQAAPPAGYWQSLGIYSLNHLARYDFEEQTLLMNRVSNLVTTKSDTFTIYALVQGWRNVGTANPVLVAQRRAAIIVDRSAATAANKVLTTLSRVPTQ